MSGWSLVRICVVHLYMMLLLRPDSVVAPGHTMMCYDCKHLRHTHACNNIRRCPPDQICGIEVHENEHEHDTYEYTLDCRDTHHCREDMDHVMVGRKRGDHHHGPPPDPHNLRCSDCCFNKDLCNVHLCAGFTQHSKVPNATIMPAPTTTATTPTQPITTTTKAIQVTAATTPTVYDPNCRDHEEDGFACATLDLFHMCTDTATISYVVAHEKCKKHCGICTAGPNAPVIAPATPPPGGVCTNYEHDGLFCNSLDLFHFCTDSSSLSYVLAHEKCRKHCGFCTGNATTVIAKSTTAAAPTAAAATTTTTAGIPVQTLTTQAPAAHASSATQLPVYTATAACRNVEENGFSCSYMDNLNICTTFEATLSQLAHEKCSKHCGFCT